MSTRSETLTTRSDLSMNWSGSLPPLPQSPHGPAHPFLPKMPKNLSFLHCCLYWLSVNHRWAGVFNYNSTMSILLYKKNHRQNFFWSLWLSMEYFIDKKWNDTCMCGTKRWNFAFLHATLSPLHVGFSITKILTTQIRVGVFHNACLCFTMELVGECLKRLFEQTRGVPALVV